MVQGALLEELAAILGVPATSISFIGAKPFSGPASLAARRALQGGGVLVQVALSPVAALASAPLAAAGGAGSVSLADAVTAVLSAAQLASLGAAMSVYPGVLGALGLRPNTNPFAVSLSASMPVALSQVSASRSPRVNATAGGTGGALGAAATAAATSSFFTPVIMYAVAGAAGGAILIACAGFAYYRAKFGGRGRAVLPGEGLDDLMRAELKLVVDKFEIETEGAAARARAGERRGRGKRIEGARARRKEFVPELDPDLLAFREA